MARSRFTSSASRSRPMKLVCSRGRLCLLAASAREVGASSGGKPAAGGESAGGKVPTQISCCRRVVAASGSLPNSLKRASLTRIIHERLRRLAKERAINALPDVPRPDAALPSSSAP